MYQAYLPSMYQYYPYPHTPQNVADPLHRPTLGVPHMAVPYSVYGNRAYASMSTLPLHNTPVSIPSYNTQSPYSNMTTRGYSQYDLQPISIMTSSRNGPASTNTNIARHEIALSVPTNSEDVEIETLRRAGVLYHPELATLKNRSPDNQTARDTLLQHLRDIGKIDISLFEKMYTLP